ncbi:sulfotransferase domain-containing protein [Sneathiella limimaris]|uniref:sulfotransferase domain-containing protein n=1 Tax=Sneathiella limimaris TaxID=1964213 RepID=UPI00146AA802|nr:sulfotransferase domain-containing protein [Sneathiella limimaris]
MPSIVWIASYPKSGNTWVRMLLNNYFLGGENRQDLNSLDLSTFGGSSKSSYRAVTDEDVDKLTDPDIMKLTPKAHAFIASRGAGLKFVKTHNLLNTLHGVPLITPEVTRSAFYILRNPLDTVISVADHFGLSLDQAIEFMNNQSGSTAPNETMVRQVFSSWANNIASWTQRPPFPVWVIRYEDLHADPTKTMGNALKFLGVNLDEKMLQRAIRQSSFKSLKAMEKKDGFAERSQHSKSFFRSGKTGQWRSKLTSEQVDRIISTNRPLMQHFGYLPEGY